MSSWTIWEPSFLPNQALKYISRLWWLISPNSGWSYQVVSSCCLLRWVSSVAADTTSKRSPEDTGKRGCYPANHRVEESPFRKKGSAEVRAVFFFLFFSFLFVFSFFVCVCVCVLLFFFFFFFFLLVSFFFFYCYRSFFFLFFLLLSFFFFLLLLSFFSFFCCYRSFFFFFFFLLLSVFFCVIVWFCFLFFFFFCCYRSFFFFFLSALSFFFCVIVLFFSFFFCACVTPTSCQGFLGVSAFCCIYFFHPHTCLKRANTTMCWGVLQVRLNILPTILSQPYKTREPNMGQMLVFIFLSIEKTHLITKLCFSYYLFHCPLLFWVILVALCQTKQIFVSIFIYLLRGQSHW